MKKAKKTGKKPPLKKALSASKKKRKSAKKTLSVKAGAAAPSKKAQSRRKKKPVAAARATATKAPPKSAAKKPLKARSAGKKLSGKSKAEKPPAYGGKVRFKLKNVRCFEGEQSFEIRPLTFITGENSTGKTTLIGCFHTLFANRLNNINFNFNEEPYEMGSFDTIFSKVNGKRRAHSVSFELSVSSCKKPEMKYTVYFVKDRIAGRPVVSDIDIFIEDFFRTHIKFKDKKIHCKLDSLKNRADSFQFSFDVSERPYERFSFLSALRFIFRELVSSQDGRQFNEEQTKSLEKFLTVWRECKNSLSPFFSLPFAPVRSNPKRFYSSFMEEPGFDPEGGNIPMRLRNINIQDKKLWKDLLNELKKFGKDSELFYDIKRKEHRQTGHFELHLKTKTSVSNIRDTGYGTSQILPVLTDLFLSPPGSRLLLQQPEVHLHPKAQAELSSLFVDCVKKLNKSFLIETHSDYMVNRARTAVRKGLIPADDLSLIYLESRKGRVHAHNILFDKEGDMIEVPKGYRDFFLKEMDDFLGVED